MDPHLRNLVGGGKGAPEKGGEVSCRGRVWGMPSHKVYLLLQTGMMK